MKKALLILFVMSAFIVNAQSSVVKEQKAPKYEKKGDLVKVTFYYETGEVREQGFYDSDKKLSGKWMQFDKEGNKTTIANYYKGDKVGTWLIMNGDHMLEVDYENSKIASVSKLEDKSTIADN